MTRPVSAFSPPERRSDRDALTGAVWGFLAGAYRKGVLDEALALAGGLLDPKIDLGQALGDFEDALSQADFGSLERMSAEVLAPLLQALSDEKVLESLHVLLLGARPLVAAAVRAAGGDVRALTAAAGGLAGILAALKPVARAVLPVAARACRPAVEAFLEERAGPTLTAALNAACRAAGRHSEAVSRFVSRVFAGVDGPAFRAAADVVVDAVLDERPPLAQWTAATVTKRVRKRVQARRGGRHGRD